MRDILSTATGLLAAVILAALIASAPWAYGGVEHWFQAWVAAALVIGTAAAAFQALLSERSVTVASFAAAIVPLVAFTVLAATQWWSGAAAETTSVVVETPETIYPAATRLAIASLLAAIAAAAIGAILFSREPAFQGLLAFCLLSAAVVAFLGIAMKLTGDDRIIRGVTFVGTPFARFVNRNNACAYITAGMAAGLAVLRDALRPGIEVERNPFTDRRSWRLDRTTRLLIVVTLLSICLAGVIASRSRGGTIAAGVTLVTALAFFRGEGWGRRLLLFTPLVGTALVLVAWVGLSSSALERFQGLSAEAVFRDGRIPHWKNAMGAVKARPYFGSGVGTYGYAHQEFSKRPEEFWYEHADNQFVEVLVEGGAAGAAAVIAIAVLAAVSLYRGRTQPVSGTLIASVSAGQATHAFFDYGIIVPAVTLIVATLWGAGIAHLWTATEDLSRRPAWLNRVVLAGFTVLVAIGIGWAFQEQRSAAAVQHFAGDAAGANRAGGIEPSESEQSIAGLTAALEKRPDDAVGQRELARLYLYRFRSAESAVVRRVNGTLSEEAAWRAASLVNLHREVNRLAGAGAVTGVASLRQDPLAQRDLVPARNHLLAAEKACNRLPGIRIPLAALSFLDPDGNPSGIGELQTAVSQFPTDGDMLRTAGQMAWQAGDNQLAARCWKASFRMGSEGFDSISRFLMSEVGAAQTVEIAVPNDPEAVLSLIIDPLGSFDRRLRVPIGNKLTELARTLPNGLLRSRVEANANWQSGRVDQAAERFETLVKNQPLDVGVRVNYAMFCKDEGRMGDALDQLTVATALAPQRSDLRRLLATWEADSRRESDYSKHRAAP